MWIETVKLSFTHSIYWARLHELRGSDEQMIGGLGTHAAIRLLDRLLVASPGPMLKPGRAASLTAADRDRLLVAIYHRTFGSRIAGTLTCGDCGKAFDLDFDLLALQSALQPADATLASPKDPGPMAYALEDGRRFRLPTGEDEIAVWHLSVDGACAELLQRCVIDGDPPESFDLTLELDATDELEKGGPVSVVTGVADRIAAMEMLRYPQEGSLLGELLGSVSTALGGGEAEVVPRGSVPVVLFVWGPGRIVPVRLTSFKVDEQAFSPILYPVHATVTIGLQILADKDLTHLEDSLSKDIAIAAFKFTRKQKQVLAAANLANAVESILGMLLF